MSYILDALRKSEQQRRQGAAPLARLAQAAETGPVRRSRSLNGMIAVLLIGSGVAVGWWRPWAGPAMPIPAPAATVALPPAPPLPEARNATPAPPAEPERPEPAAGVPAAPPAPAAGTPEAGSLSSLPPELRQVLPDLTMSLHSHSANPKERLVMLNGTMLHEGDQVTPGLLLEEVTPDGAILSYRGQRFSIGLRQQAAPM